MAAQSALFYTVPHASRSNLTCN